MSGRHFVQENTQLGQNDIPPLNAFVLSNKIKLGSLYRRLSLTCENDMLPIIYLVKDNAFIKKM